MSNAHDLSRYKKNKLIDTMREKFSKLDNKPSFKFSLRLTKLRLDTFSNNSVVILPATFKPTPSALDIIVLSPDEIAKVSSSKVRADNIERAAFGPTP